MSAAEEPTRYRAGPPGTRRRLVGRFSPGDAPALSIADATPGQWGVIDDARWARYRGRCHDRGQPAASECHFCMFTSWRQGAHHDAASIRAVAARAGAARVAATEHPRARAYTVGTRPRSRICRELPG